MCKAGVLREGALTAVSLLVWLTAGGQAGIMSRKAVIQGGTLRFPAVEPSDEAEYLCRVRSSAGQHVARAFLQVHGTYTVAGAACPGPEISPSLPQPGVVQGDQPFHGALRPQTKGAAAGPQKQPSSRCPGTAPGADSTHQVLHALASCHGLEQQQWEQGCRMG